MSEPARPQRALGDSSRPVVVVTGAGGAVGRHLIEHLGASYHVVGVSRFEADLTSEDWEGKARALLGGREVYGVIHAAWISAPQGGLLDTGLDVIAHQLEFGGLTTIRLGRWLASSAGSAGRLILLGSTAATVKPVLNLGAYSLGKAVLEQTVRLLAPELARKNITVNAVLPSFMSAGMNASKNSRAVLLETAKVPLGRLCTVEDVAASVDYLLSPGAAFVSGQLLPLTGAQL